MSTIAELVTSFIKLRDKKSQIKAAYEREVASINELQDKIEALLLVKFDEMGVESVRTPDGTAYTSLQGRASIGDWDSFIAHVKNHDAYELLERRVSTTAVGQYKAANEDLPPGVNWTETRVVNFRRS